MARPPRIQFEGARYHVLNRGNYRHAIFSVDGAGECFEEVLFRGCGRFGWVVHAYVILSNHYHLVLETPDGNLVVGMQWVQSTFANRFNRLVGERGHVFQGRYRALLVEDGDYLLRVVNYVHLNPVRAGLSFLGKTPADIHTARKGARWKVVLGAWIKGQCGVSNRWLSERLNMGNPCNVSRMLAAERKQAPHRDKLWRKLERARYKA